MRLDVESVSVLGHSVFVVFKDPFARYNEPPRHEVELPVTEAARLQALLLLAIADHANGATR